MQNVHTVYNDNDGNGDGNENDRDNTYIDRTCT